MMDDLLPGLAAARDVHPVLIHFPIALWFTALLFWILALRGNESLWKAGCWLLYLASLSALAAVGTGLWAADRLGHDSPGHDLVHIHRNFMLATTTASVVVSLATFRLRHHGTTRLRLGLLIALLLTVTLSTLGADRGALLVYGYGVGTRPGEETEDTAPSDPDTESHGAHPHGSPGHAH